MEDRTSGVTHDEIWAGRDPLKAEILWEDMRADARGLGKDAFHATWRAGRA